MLAISNFTFAVIYIIFKWTFYDTLCDNQDNLEIKDDFLQNMIFWVNITYRAIYLAHNILDCTVKTLLEILI